MSKKARQAWIEQMKETVFANESAADDAVRKLFMLYDEAAFSIENELHTMFSKYAVENKLTEAQAAKLISGKKYSTWRKSIEEYLKKIPEGAADSKTLLELNTLAMKSRISRKEELLSNVYRNMADLAGAGTDKLSELLADIVRTNYYRSGYTLQLNIGLGFNMSKINEKLVKQVLDHTWNVKHFSKSLWEKIDVLSATVKREISYGLIKGSSVQSMAKQINDVMDKGRYAAERLVRTECKHFATQGELAGYEESGIEEYQFVGGTEGSGRCDCAELNGNRFKLKDAEEGVNLPPIHPNCKCGTIAVYELSVFGKREGVTPLAENMKFQEWKTKYVK